MSNAMRKLLILIISSVSIIYLIYRGFFTLNLTTTYAVAASAALLLAETYGVLCVLLYCVQVWDPSEPPQQPVLPGRTVDVFVPTYNEDVMILRATLEACVRMEYPHRTYLCDDGGTEQRLNDPEKGAAARDRAAKLKALCAELGVIYTTRPKNEHAKAGNLNHALRQTDGEFVIILDADHVPEPHFITRLIGYFADEKLAYVQTPHAFYNFDSFQSQNSHNDRKYWEEGAMFYEVIQPGRNRWGCPIFAGSAAMFRRAALAEVGYIALETITEDMHTGLRINALGWTALAISERLVAGQAAPDITTFHSQRLRWGEGNLSIMAHDNPLTTRGLTLAQRLCYLGSMVHWAGGVFKLIIYLTPIMMMISGVAPLKELTVTLGAVTLAYLAVSLFGVRALGNGHGSIVNGEFFCMVNFWTQIRGTMRALFKRGQQTFVVTSKRGRQSKSSWPFVYPHLALAALSVVALAWGWSRYFYGVSDDLVRPLIPTVWIVVHLALIWMVVRRSLWPEDQRFSYRHATAVAVEYARADGPTGVGVTNDLSDQGVGFVAYADIPVGTALEVRLVGGGEDVRIAGVVKRAERVAHDRTLGCAGYKIGVKFDKLDGPALDAVNRITYHYAVPRLYQEYGRGNKRTPLARLGGLVHRTFFSRRAQPRRVVRLPAVVTAGESRCATVTEDLTPVSTAVLLGHPLPVGAEVGLTVRTPIGEARGAAEVVRVTAQRIGARTYHRTALKLRDPHGPDYARVQNLLTGAAPHRLEPALNPDRREPKQVKTVGVHAIAALAAAVLIALAGMAFPIAHRDDVFLHEVAQAGGRVTPEQAARIDAIYRAATADPHPSTDRLVLLMQAMPRAGRVEDCDPLITVLSNRDPSNADLRLALAATLDRKGDYAEAEKHYLHLLGEIDRGRVRGAKRVPVYLAAARSRINAGDVETAAARFDAYMAAAPDDGAVRNEYAGVLIRAGRYAAVPELYAAAEPDYRGRVLLMSALALAKNFDAAEAQGKTILSANPEDPAAQLLLAELTAHRKEYDSARKLFQQIAARPGVTPDTRLKLARLQLLNHDFDDALGQYQAVIAAGVVTDESCRGFADAAAGATALTEAHRRTAELIDRRPETAASADSVYLGRLAYLYSRLKMNDRALALSERAVALNPTDKEIIKQRYALLLDQNKAAEAAALVAPHRADPAMRLALVQAHLKGKELDAAEREARALRAAAPNDLDATRLLADVLSWKKEYAESLALFETLRVAKPNDADVSIRIAQVTLWSGDASGALKHFDAILAKSFDRPAVWPDYVAAASAADKVSAEQFQTVRRIADQPAVRDGTDAVLLARLGWVMVREERAELAEPHLTRAVALRPADPGVRKELARVLTGAGRPADALRQFDGLTDLTAEDHVQLAGIHVALKDFAAAERACRFALITRPNDPAIDRLLADVLSWGGKYDESLGIFRRLRAAKPGDPDLLVRTAEVQIWSGVPTDALLLAAGALEADIDQPRVWPVYVWAAAAVPNLNTIHNPLLERVVSKIDTAAWQPVALARLALVHHRLGKPDPARELMDRAIKAPNKPAGDVREIAVLLGQVGRAADGVTLFEGRPLAPEDRSVLAELAASARDWPNAERHFKSVLADKPDDVGAAIRLAEVVSLKGDHKAAKAAIDALARKAPTDGKVLTAAGEIELRAGDPAAAAGRFEAALRAVPNYAPARRGFIDAASAAGDRLTAAQVKLAAQYADVIAAATAIEPVHACRLAWVMIQHREIPRADKLLDRCVLAATEPAARRELAPVLAARGRGREAVQALTGLKAEPEDLLLLANVHASLNDFPAATAACRSYLAARPDDLKAERQLADLLSWSGEHDDALQALTRLQSKLPADATIPVRTAETLWRMGRQVEAMDLFGKLMAAAGKAAGDPSGLRAGFVLAAFEAEKVTPAILEIADRAAAAAGQSTDVLFLARLGYVLKRAGRATDADAMFDRAVAVMRIDDVDTRWLLGGVMTLAGRRADATRAWAGITPTGENTRRLALLYASAYDYKAALAVCDDGLKTQPGDRALAIARADVLTWSRDYPAAIAQLKKLSDMAPDVELTVRLTEVSLRANRPADALALIEPEAAKKPARAKAVRLFVEAVGGVGNLTAEQAALVTKMYREVPLVGEPADPLFAARVGLALRVAGATRESEAMLARAAKDTPRDPRTRRALAGLMATAGRSDQALKLYEGLDAEPDDLLQLAYLNVGRKDYVAAEKAARGYLVAHPGDPLGERALADILAWNGNFKAALPVFERLTKARPMDTELAIRVAEVRLADDDRVGAAAVFARAVEEQLGTALAGQPGGETASLDARARAGFAAAVAALPDLPPKYAELAAKLAKALAADDDDAFTAGRLGVILARAGRGAEAAALADRVAKIEVKDPGARRELAGILAAVGQPRRAVTVLESLQQTADDRLMLSGLQMTLGEFAAAEKTCRALLADAPGDARATRQLAEALSGKKEFKEAAALFEKLHKANPTDDAVRLRLAEALLAAGSYDAAADQFLPLVTAGAAPAVEANYLAAVANVKAVTPAHQKAVLRVGASDAAKAATDVTFLVNLAWVHYRCEQPKACDAFLTAAAALKPTDPAVRRSMAGVLEARGRAADALAALDGLPLDDADRVQIARLHTAAKDYAAAEKAVRAVLDKMPTSAPARRQLAEIQFARKEYRAAADLLDKLVFESPADREVAVRAAEALLADRDYEGALVRFRRLLADKDEHPELWAPYIDAAASAKKLGVEDGELIDRIAKQSDKDTTRSAAFWSRLGWVLLQFKHKEKATALIDRAVAMKPTESDAKRELAGVLSAVDRYKEALALYEGLELTTADKVRVVELSLAVRDLDRASKLLGELLAADPRNRTLRRLNANLLLWTKKHAEALKEFTALKQELPGDREIQVGFVLATLWSGDAKAALPMLHDLLERDMEQPVLWRPYLEAVAQVNTVTKEHEAIVVRIAKAVGGLKDPEAELLGSVGVALARIKQSDLAIGMLKKAVEANPKSDAFRLQLAQTLTAARRYDEAEKIYAELLTPRATRP
jgi:predicted Zn-dependent protease/cellulose synthase/poly-beta-1,6-N-acetylglucosamine synthase-like glycosyltransferase